MKPPRQSTDGFIPRRGATQPVRRSIGDGAKQSASRGETGLRRPPSSGHEVIPTTLQRSKQGLSRTTKGMSHSGKALSRADIDESLRAIVDEPAADVKRGRRRVRRQKKVVGKSKRIARIVAVIILVVALVVGGWLGYKTLRAGGSIFKGGLLGLLQSQPLKQDKDGRSAILVLGTSEDDPGHEGGELTDSMMVISLDQTKKTAAMFSIPRDLYVAYGESCPAGDEGKINAYFSCVNEGTSAADEQDRLTKSREFIGKIFGMDIQYAVRVNNTVIKEAVDAVDGIDVEVKGNGPVPYGVSPGSVLDRNFDWRCGYKCNYVKYSPGVHHMDGEHALFLSMARGNSAPTYGLVDSNFDREKNQQKILIALKEKAASTGTLANIGKVTKLMDAMGDNLRTTFDTSEVRTLMQLGLEIDTASIKTLDLFDGEKPVVTTGSYGGASVVLPSAGIFRYGEIRQYLAQKFSSNPVTREGARVVVANGSGVSGVAQTEADTLMAAGYRITSVTNAPVGEYPTITVYKIGEGNDATAQKLASRFSVTIETGPPPLAVDETVDFVIVIGKDRSKKTSE